MSLLGKLVNAAGQAACIVGGVGIALTGEIVGGVSDMVSSDSKFGEEVRSATDKIGAGLWNSSITFVN